MDTQEPQEQVVKSVEELTAEVEKLTRELEFAKSENEKITRWWRSLETQKDELEEYLNDFWEDLGDHAEKIAEIFEISTEVEKEVSVQISGSMTIKAPRSYDWDDLRYSSFTVSIEADWGADFTIEGYDLDVDRTDVD